MKFQNAMMAPLLSVMAVAVGFPLLYSLWLGFTSYQLVSGGVA
ncbi:MAG: sugar ABC transporter permease, partial [Microbacteriaceae bacterium]|nr:sugar ABC transporter permease [Microbacteriaceae bacterium]